MNVAIYIYICTVDYQYFYQRYYGCISGREIVDWLHGHTGMSRLDCTEIGKNLFRKNAFYCYDPMDSKNAQFYDKSTSFYTFTPAFGPRFVYKYITAFPKGGKKVVLMTPTYAGVYCVLVNHNRTRTRHTKLKNR